MLVLAEATVAAERKRFQVRPERSPVCAVNRPQLVKPRQLTHLDLMSRKAGRMLRGSVTNLRGPAVSHADAAHVPATRFSAGVGLGEQPEALWGENDKDLFVCTEAYTSGTARRCSGDG